MASSPVSPPESAALSSADARYVRLHLKPGPPGPANPAAGSLGESGARSRNPIFPLGKSTPGLITPPVVSRTEIVCGGIE